MFGLFMKRFALFLSIVLVVPCFSVAALAANDLEATPSGVPIAELEQFVDDYVSEYIGVTTAGASIVMLEHGNVVLEKAYGYADTEKETLVDTNTVFEWGSATKLLVWTSVMQLVEQGKLDLNTDIREYLPDGFFTKLKYDTPITIYNLMHHNAGWEDRLTDLFYHSADEVASLEEELRIGEPNQVNEPGYIVAYSNYGVALAGYLVERVSEQPFYEYVTENIFAPLAMSDTTIHPTQEDNPSVAEKRESIFGHTASGNRLVRSKNERIYIGLYPAGSAMGTAADAAKFLAALTPSESETSPLFESNDALEEMLSTSLSYGDGFLGNAHGFWVRYTDVKSLGHGGNTDSFSSYLTIAPDTGFALVVMTNQAAETSLCYGLSNELFGDYSIEYTGEMPDAHELEGSYMIVRRPYSGFSKLYGFLQIINVKAIDNNTLEISDEAATQVAPHVFYTDGSIMHFTVENGTVSRVSALYTELVPFPKSTETLSLVSLVLAIICVLYIVVALFIIIIGGIRNKRKSIPSSPLKKANMFLNLAGVAVLVNIAVLIVRAFQYSSYEALKIHFGVNIAYIVFTLISVGFIVVKRKDSDISKGRKLFYICSAVVALVFSALIVAWELFR